MEASLYHLGQLFDSLVSSDPVTFLEVASHKKITGVYIIYNAENEILYIGSTNNFYVRFGTDLKHETTHTLTKKMIKDGTHIDRAAAIGHFKNQCYYRIAVCSNKRQAEALEHYCIWLLNPKYNK